MFDDKGKYTGGPSMTQRVTNWLEEKIAEIQKATRILYGVSFAFITDIHENSLSSVLAIAYLSAMQYYFKPIREFPSGRGFADFVFIPKPEYKQYYPAIVAELKWNKNAKTALKQIRERKYPDAISDYTGDILLVGISYDSSSKEHQCVIEKIQNMECKLVVVILLIEDYYKDNKQFMEEQNGEGGMQHESDNVK